MNFHVGQKVVCIYMPPVERFSWARYPEVKGVYTVRKVTYADKGQMVLLFKEVVNKAGGPHGRLEPGFTATCFRPVTYPKQSEKADVARFKHHLTSTDQPVDA